MYKILKAETLAAKIHLMVVHAPRVASHCQPGQFIIVKLDEKGERIPLTICDYDREEGTVTIVFQEIGVSTIKMAELKAGDAFRDFVGPLGCPSEFVEEDIEELKKKKMVFVAGGVGTAPVYPQVKWLHEHGITADVILGAKTKDMVILEKELGEVSNLYVTTDDGSYGRAGMVTKTLEDLVTNEGKHYEDLRQTKVTQPAVFLHSVISALCMGDDFKPEMTAGHSLGEFSALVAAGALSFEDGLKLVYARAMAMQKACEATPSTMAAIIALPDEKVEEICAAVNAEGEVCVPANYNCPGQIVISGSVPGIEKACELMKAAGAKRALPLKVGGAFHSPLMDPAKIELEAAIKATEIHTPKCPVYQNVDALPHTDPAEIKKNLVAQLTASVRWTQSVKNMVADGATDFTECGPGAVLQGLIKKIDGTVNAHGIA